MEVLSDRETQPAPRPAERDAAESAADEAAPGPQYIYGIVSAGAPSLELGPIGIGGRPVRTLAAGPVAALTSDLDSPAPLRALRRNLLPHHKVLTAAMQAPALLPLRFGHVASGPAAVRRFLTTHRLRLVELLERVEGCFEVGLCLRWHEANPFEEVVKGQEELARLRDELTGGGRLPTQEEKLRLGRFFQSCLERQRLLHQEAVLKSLNAVVREFIVRPAASEAVLFDLALLVSRQSFPLLDRRLGTVASSFGPEYHFELKGPFPPFSFADFAQAG